jgi:hypothetical protein
VGERLAAGALSRAAREFEIVRRHGIPVFIGEDFRPRWVLERGGLSRRVFLATIPRAGTSMMAKVLARLDLADCRLHVARHDVVDMRFAPDAIVRQFPGRLSRPIDAPDAIRLIAPGQFAFGHLGPQDASIREALGGFCVVLMIRNLRHVYPSIVRYNRERHGISPFGPEAEHFGEGPDLLAWDMDREGPSRVMGFRSLASWRSEPNALCLRYEEIVGDLGRPVQLAAMRRLAAFLEVERPDLGLEDILNTVIGQSTVTRMGQPTEPSKYWSDEVEARYRRIGFAELNRDLGYPEPSLD